MESLSPFCPLSDENFVGGDAFLYFCAEKEIFLASIYSLRYGVYFHSVYSRILPSVVDDRGKFYLFLFNRIYLIDGIDLFLFSFFMAANGDLLCLGVCHRTLFRFLSTDRQYAV